MPLDPHLGALLQSMAAAGRKPTWESTPAEARLGYRALSVNTLKPEDVLPVARVEDREVPGAAGPLAARVYHPEGEGPHPTIAYYHGGGYVIGDLDTHDRLCREMCRDTRAVVVSVDYRLAPEHPFPAGVDDAIASARWIRDHSRELGGNDVVAVAGDSAGGNLSAVVTQALRGEGKPLAAQCLIYPAVDRRDAEHASKVENASGYFLEAKTMAWFSDHYLGGHRDLDDPRLAPMRATSLTGLPPAVVVTAEFDPLRDEGKAYAAALRAAGVPVDEVAGPGMIHGFFDMGRWSPGAQAVVSETLARFAARLHASG